MRKLVIASLLAGQVLAAPAGAADFAESREQQAGAFAGFRLRMPLDGPARQRSIRAGLTLAPTMLSRSIAGDSEMRIAEGFELGITGRSPVRLSIGGTPVNRLAEGRTGPDGQRHGISTIGWIAIGVAAAAVIVVGAAAICASDHDCLPSE